MVFLAISIMSYRETIGCLQGDHSPPPLCELFPNSPELFVVAFEKVKASQVAVVVNQLHEPPGPNTAKCFLADIAKTSLRASKPRNVQTKRRNRVDKITV